MISHIIDAPFRFSTDNRATFKIGARGNFRRIIVKLGGTILEHQLPNVKGAIAIHTCLKRVFPNHILECCLTSSANDGGP